MGDDRLDAVAVQGVGRAALVDEDVFRFAFDLHVHRTRGGHFGRTLHAGQMAAAEAVFFACALLDDPFVEEAAEDLERFAAPRLVGASRGRCQVLERELVVREFAEQTDDGRSAVVSSGC